jgi:hypothetical protein
MKSIFKLAFLILFFLGCAKIPVQSVMLADALKVEGERMHKLNLTLLNRTFSAKRSEIDKFINDEYAPEVIKNFINIINTNQPGTDFKKEFPELMQAIMPKINARKDSLMNALEVQKGKIIDKLDADYKVFDNAALELKNLLESAVKIDKEKQALLNNAKELSNNKIDFNRLENAFDKFITSTGNVSANVVALNNDINEILDTK